MEKNEKIKNLIEALGQHEDPESVSVLEEFGTNSGDDEVREMTAQALVKKNSHDSLKLVLMEKGKGINDLSARVAMGTINELLTLEDKSEALKILNDTIELNSEDELRDTARSVKALMTFSC